MEVSQRPLTVEEEALKRNTDCIYFLASPFTCKKGNDCEFRHSEGARVNPRDCYYWLNGNCLNPKCAFRHPSLDGLFGAPGNPSGPLPSSLQAMANAPGAYNPKQSVPCYYFQMGQCIKGDRCPFMHGPPPSSNHLGDSSANGSHIAGNSDPLQLKIESLPGGNHVMKQVTKDSTSVAGTSQAVSWGLKECNTTKKLQSAAKSGDEAKGHSVKRSASPYPLNYEAPQSQPTVDPVSSDSNLSMPHHHELQPLEEDQSNGKEADDFLGESSPGFDVLVDDEAGYIRDSEYYFNEEEYEGLRNPNLSVTDFDYLLPDYDAVPSTERDRYNGKDEYGEYDGNHHRVSSERAVDRISKRRPMHRELSPDEMDSQDLRHLLSKRRRMAGLKSAVSHDRHGEPRHRRDGYVEDRYHSHSSGRRQESSFTSRLQGRISFPVRSSPDRPSDFQPERDIERRRSRIPLSRAMNYRTRPQDRIKRMPDEFFTADRRRPHRENDGDPLNFAAPKSLAELKGQKILESSQEQLGKNINTAGYSSSEDPLSFEGPKPLSDIMETKRQSASGNDTVPSSGDETNEIRTVASIGVKKSVHVGGVENSRIQTVVDEEEEDGMAEDAMEDQEGENLDGRDGDSEYEVVEGEGFKTDDGENAYREDEEEEDFTKKVGVFSS